MGPESRMQKDPRSARFCLQSEENMVNYQKDQISAGERPAQRSIRTSRCGRASFRRIEDMKDEEAGRA